MLKAPIYTVAPQSTCRVPRGMVEYPKLNRSSRLSTHLPFLFADPELVERAQTRENASTKPAAITTLNNITRGMDFDLTYIEKKKRQRSALINTMGLPRVRTPGNCRVSSLLSRSVRPEKRLPPPVTTTFARSCCCRSGSHEPSEALINWGRVRGTFGF